MTACSFLNPERWSPWLQLIAAIGFEWMFAAGLKASRGLTRVGPSALAVVGLAGGLVFLALALRRLPLSLAYPLWVGGGAIGSLLLGYWLHQEPLSAPKLAGLGLICAGVLSLKWAHT